MLSCSSTTTSSPSIVVRAFVGPLPVWSEKRRTTAREIAALTGPRPCVSMEPAGEEVGIDAPVLASLRGEDAPGGEKRTEPGDDTLTLPRTLYPRQAAARQPKARIARRFPISGPSHRSGCEGHSPQRVNVGIRFAFAGRARNRSTYGDAGRAPLRDRHTDAPGGIVLIDRGRRDRDERHVRRSEIGAVALSLVVRLPARSAPRSPCPPRAAHRTPRGRVSNDEPRL